MLWKQESLARSNAACFHQQPVIIFNPELILKKTQLWLPYAETTFKIDQSARFKEIFYILPVTSGKLPLDSPHPTPTHPTPLLSISVHSGKYLIMWRNSQLGLPGSSSAWSFFFISFCSPCLALLLKTKVSFIFLKPGERNSCHFQTA